MILSARKLATFAAITLTWGGGSASRSAARVYS